MNQKPLLFIIFYLMLHTSLWADVGEGGEQSKANTRSSINTEVNGTHNLVNEVVNKGLNNKTIDKFIKPYKDRVTSLERKLNLTASMEEKFLISEKLNKARKELDKKSQEIKKLNELISNSKFNVIRIATRIYEENGLTATLEYFKSNNTFKNDTYKNMKALAGGYRFQAKILILDNKYDEAKKAYEKALQYDKNINSLFDYAYFLPT